jgi:hypothetical protein
MPAAAPRHSTSHSGVSTELTPMIGVGASDIQHAIRAEIARIIKQTKGDELAQSRLLIGMLRDRSLITDSEVTVLNGLAKVGHEADKKDARKAYFESRDVYNKMLAGGEASPVALAIASSAVGSYEITTARPDGSGGVVFKKSSGDWEGRGAAAGALIGSFWGPAGAALGGVIGGGVGHAVDKCLD